MSPSQHLIGQGFFNLGDVGPNGFLGWTANEFGGGANDFNMIFASRGAQQKTTEVVVTGANITVYLAADSAGRVVATAADVYAAVTSSAAASAIVTMNDPSADGFGSMIVEPFNQSFFSGGSGANLDDYFTFNTWWAEVS